MLEDDFSLPFDAANDTDQGTSHLDEYICEIIMGKLEGCSMHATNEFKSQIVIEQLEKIFYERRMCQTV